MHKSRFFLCCSALLAVVLLSCEKDSVTPDPVENPPVSETPDDGENPPADDDQTGSTNDKIVTNISAQRQSGYVLINDPGNDRVYLMDKDTGEPYYEWTLPLALGNDAELLPDGSLLASLAAENPPFTFGGFGGSIQRIAADGSVTWTYDLATEDQIIHHEALLLPSGNILTMVWERIPKSEAEALGYSGSHENLYVESIIEIDPATNQIVWKWHSAEHLIQDVDTTRSTFGDVGAHPEKIDVNYRDTVLTTIPDNGDTMHANALAYDAERDLIFLSVNYYSEVWVIDHSASAEEVKGSTGGNFGRGGDLVYRFGNPSAYRNTAGERFMFYNHTPTFVPDSDTMLIYVNDSETSQGPSTVYEIRLPSTLSLLPNTNNEPEIIWQFTHPDMYSDKVSSAFRLPNGNTLITIGTYGCWEVTSGGSVVWRFKDSGFFWRGYHVDADDPVLEVLFQ